MGGATPAPVVWPSSEVHGMVSSNCPFIMCILSLDYCSPRCSLPPSYKGHHLVLSVRWEKNRPLWQHPIIPGETRCSFTQFHLIPWEKSWPNKSVGYSSR